jgi:RNA polymerase sigma factor for flagellar operon FliA
MEALVVNHTGLVHFFAKRYKGVDRADLVQAGMLGLVEAAKKYDGAKGTFASYASYWIRYRMREVAMGRYAVNPMASRNGRKLVGQMARVRAVLEAQEGEVTIDRLASALGVSEDEITACQAVFAPTCSDEALSKQAADLPSIEEQIDSKRFYANVKARLRAYMAKLSERDQRILRECVLASEPMTCVQMATILGVSKQRVHQIVQRLRKDLAVLRL